MVRAFVDVTEIQHGSRCMLLQCRRDAARAFGTKRVATQIKRGDRAVILQCRRDAGHALGINNVATLMQRGFSLSLNADRVVLLQGCRVLFFSIAAAIVTNVAVFQIQRGDSAVLSLCCRDCARAFITNVAAFQIQRGDRDVLLQCCRDATCALVTNNLELKLRSSVVTVLISSNAAVMRFTLA